MSPSGILRKVDAVTVRVPDIDTGIGFYVDVLGHRVKWRNDSVPLWHGTGAGVLCVQG